MLFSLLAGCAFLFSARPEPLLLSVALPSAAHTRSIPARQLIAPLPANDTDIQEISDADVSDYCDWASGAAADDRIAKKLLARGLLSFTLLEASASGVRIGGEEVVALDQGRVPADEKKGILITNVYDRLLEHAEASKDYGVRCPGADFTGQLGLALAPELPYETAVALMYSAGQAQFGTFFLLTDGPVGPPLTQAMRPEADSRQVRVSLSDGQATVRVGEQERSSSSAGIPALVGEATSGQGAVGCGLITPDGPTPWQDVVSSADAVAGQGATQLVFAAGRGSAEEAAPIGPSAPGTLAISLETTLPVIAVELPVLGPPRGGGGECDFNGIVATPLPPSRVEVVGVLTDGPLVSGDGLERPLIEAVLRRHENMLRYCYQRELVKDPTLQGTLTVSFDISGDGTVSEAVVSSSTLDSVLVERCLASRFPKLQFPDTKGGVTVYVDKTYTFTPQEPG